MLFRSSSSRPTASFACAPGGGDGRTAPVRPGGNTAIEPKPREEPRSVPRALAFSVKASGSLPVAFAFRCAGEDRRATSVLGAEAALAGGAATFEADMAASSDRFIGGPNAACGAGASPRAFAFPATLRSPARRTSRPRTQSRAKVARRLRPVQRLVAPRPETSSADRVATFSRMMTSPM